MALRPHLVRAAGITSGDPLDDEALVLLYDAVVLHPKSTRAAVSSREWHTMRAVWDAHAEEWVRVSRSIDFAALHRNRVDRLRAKAGN